MTWNFWRISETYVSICLNFTTMIHEIWIKNHTILKTNMSRIIVTILLMFSLSACGRDNKTTEVITTESTWGTKTESSELVVGQPHLETWSSMSIKSPVLVVDKISGWKTYTDKEHGFEFQYPSVCNISNDPMVWGIQLSRDIEHISDNCNLSIVYYDNFNSPRTSLQEFTEAQNISNAQKTYFQDNEALTGIFENKEIRYRGDEIYVIHNHYLYDISYTLMIGNKKLNTKTPMKILSTFRFTK